MPNLHEFVEKGSNKSFIQIDSKLFMTLFEQHLVEQNMTLEAFAKKCDVNSTHFSTLRRTPPKQMYLHTMRKILAALGLTAKKAESMGLFLRAGKIAVISKDRAAVKCIKQRREKIAAMLRGVAAAPAAIAPPVRIIIADTELTVAPMAASIQPAVVEHLGWQLTVKQLSGATE